MQSGKKKSLPSSFRKLFWSYNFSRINPARHQKTIIVQTINYGDLDQWRWLARYYGGRAIKKALEEMPATQIRPRAMRLASILFSVRNPSYAPRGSRKGR